MEVMREKYGATAGVPPSHPGRVDAPECRAFQQQSCMGHTQELNQSFPLAVDGSILLQYSCLLLTYNQVILCCRWAFNWWDSTLKVPCWFERYISVQFL